MHDVRKASNHRRAAGLQGAAESGAEQGMNARMLQQKHPVVMDHQPAAHAEEHGAGGKPQGQHALALR